MDTGYAAAKLALKGSGGPFKGWITSGREWEEFDVDGTVHSDTESDEDLRSRLAPNMARGALGGLGISSRLGLQIISKI